MRNLRSILPLLLLSCAMCRAQPCNLNPLKPSTLPSCPTIMDQLGQAMDASREFKKDVAIMNRAIAGARARYWKAFPNGPGIAEAEQAFLGALTEKDFYYLMFSLQEGITGQAAMMPNVIAMDLDTTSQDLHKFPTNVDGGINPYAFPLFVQWVNALRRAEGRERDGAMASPLIIAEAWRDKSNWRKAYEDARNWAEFLSSGLDFSRYLTPQVYMVNQMEWDVSLGLARAKPKDLPDPKAAALDLYNFLVKIFGEKEVTAAAAAVLHAPKNSAGGLATRAVVDIGTFVAAPSNNPYMVFLTKLITGSPRAWAISICFDQYAVLGGQATEAFNSKEQWTKAVSTYDQVVAKFGEPAVLGAAARLKDLPKNDRGGPAADPLVQSSLYWFTTLLKDPKTPLPESTNFLAGSYDPRWIGKIVTVRGTVSRIEIEKNKHPPYATIHFTQSKDDRFTAFSPNSDIVEGLNLVGKVIEVHGGVQEWRLGAGVRFLVTNDLKVLDDGALANFKESSPEWMKAPYLDTSVENPAYLAWKKFQPGATANYVSDLLHEIKPGTDQYTRSRISRWSFTLVSIDAERAIVRLNDTVNHMSGGSTSSSDDRIIKARVAAPGKVDDPSRVTTTGEETLTINGKEIHTRWKCVTQAKDPLTFTKTWTSDEIPGGVVREQQQSHARVSEEEYRNISHTLYAPGPNVEPQLGDAPAAAPPAGTTTPSPAPIGKAAPPVAPPQLRAAPAAPPPLRGRAAPQLSGSAASQVEFLKRYSAVLTRAAQARSGLVQAERKLAAAGIAVPDHIVAARERLASQQRAAGQAMSARDNTAAEQDLRDMEETLGVIEKFVGK